MGSKDRVDKKREKSRVVTRGKRDITWVYIYIYIFFGWVGRSFEEKNMIRKRAGLVHLDRYVAKRAWRKWDRETGSRGGKNLYSIIFLLRKGPFFSARYPTQPISSIRSEALRYDNPRSSRKKVWMKKSNNRAAAMIEPKSWKGKKRRKKKAKKKRENGSPILFFPHQSPPSLWTPIFRLYPSPAPNHSGNFERDREKKGKKRKERITKTPWGMKGKTDGGQIKISTKALPNPWSISTRHAGSKESKPHPSPPQARGG